MSGKPKGFPGKPNEFLIGSKTETNIKILRYIGITIGKDIIILFVCWDKLLTKHMIVCHRYCLQFSQTTGDLWFDEFCNCLQECEHDT